MTRLLAVLVVVATGGLSGAGCSKRPAPEAGGVAAGESKTAGSSSVGATGAPAGASEFDRKWSSLAATDVETFYVGDDRGEGLMGNVRRSRRPSTTKVALANKGAVDPNAPADVPSSEEIERVIRQNLPGVSACYLRLSRAGDQRSGKAIVSFQVGASGEVQNTKVEAPAFDGTTLPNCVSGLVSHWAFPKSAKGGLAISYPFVFVGG